MDGYKEAEVINENINEVLRKFRLEENVREYFLFLRAIRTTLDVLESVLGSSGRGGEKNERL